MESDEQFFVTDRTRWRQWLPWLHLFRAFRIAFGVRPLLLAVAAILLIDAGQQVIAVLPFSAGNVDASRDWSRALDDPGRKALAVDLELLAARPLDSLDGATRHTTEILRPLWTIAGPGRSLFKRGNSWSQIAAAWTTLLWALVVWGVFGVGLSRMAAIRFATETSISTNESLGFSLGKLVSSLGAPLLPLVGVCVLWLICLAGGLVGRIPTAGPVLVGVFWWLPLLLSGLMAIILLGLAAGWPLMLSSIGTEDADAFDAYSRVYGYLFGRPWYALWLTIVALIYGSLLLVFLATVISVLMPLSEWAVASGLGESRTRELFLGDGNEMSFGSAAVLFWGRAVGLMLVGFTVSYFWTASTIVYFLLRKSVDAIPLDAVSLRKAEKESESAATMPLVGVAAAEQREQSDEDISKGQDPGERET